MAAPSVARFLCRTGYSCHSHRFALRSTIVRIFQKNYSTEACALRYSEHGDPSKVVHKVNISIPEQLGGNEVQVKMLASPVNPADINTIQGIYPIKPQLPAVGGFEGVGEVVQVGENVTKLKTGQIVIPGVNSIGSWCTDVVCSEDNWLVVPDGTPSLFAATLRVNNCTAYRMLKDYVDLQPGDVVIQNASNSGCGQAVIQIAAARGLKTINILRDRPNFSEVKEYLQSLGATEVVSDVISQKQEMKAVMEKYPKPKLALNAVGGKAAITLMKFLEHDATMVTYGGMSKMPVTVPTGFLIFNNIHIVGHWMSRWHDLHGNSKEAQSMISELCHLSQTNKLKLPKHRLVPLSEYRSAITAAMEPYVSEKQILVMKP